MRQLRSVKSSMRFILKFKKMQIKFCALGEKDNADTGMDWKRESRQSSFRSALSDIGAAVLESAMLCTESNENNPFYKVPRPPWFCTRMGVVAIQSTFTCI